MDKTKVLKEAIQTYGQNAQIDMAIEEMSELTKALLKDRRSLKSQRLEVAEEIADVLITVEQLIMIYDNEELVNKTVNSKIARLAKRLKEHPRNHMSTYEFERTITVTVDKRYANELFDVEIPPTTPWNTVITENKNKGE
jgi:NTP pyrophosphatase (non-canonical NTP hydrolase)